jgi:hypothetical protein
VFEVRVCEACYEKSGKKTDLVAKSATNGETAVTMSETGKKALDTSNTGDAKRREEEEQLALALAISQSEAEEQVNSLRHLQSPLPDSRNVNVN